MLKLDDAELDIVMRAAIPITPDRRNSFLVEVANELSRHSEIGVGLISRVCKDVQRRHFDYPDLSHDDSKYR